MTAVEPTRPRFIMTPEQHALGFPECEDESDGHEHRLVLSDFSLDAEPCPHDSHSGVDETDLLDPAKVWRCDHCGQTRVGPR